MIVFDSSSVRGYPLQYYSTGPIRVDFWARNPHFSTIEYYGNADMSDDLSMPHSPGTHSDSDNSVSSSDVTSRDIVWGSGSSLKKNDNDVNCCWKACGLWFPTLDQLASHVTKVHASSGPGGLFYCGWEGCSRNLRGFNARYKMLVHVRTHTNEKPHQCTECDKSFSRAENLKIHFRSHSGEKPYICSVPGCRKAYSNSSDRFKHTRTHQVNKPYTCKVPGCPKRYTDPSSLRKHVKTYRHSHFLVTSNTQPKTSSSNTSVPVIIKTNAGSDVSPVKQEDNVLLSTRTSTYDEDTRKNTENCTHSTPNIKLETDVIVENNYISNHATPNAPVCNCKHTCSLSRTSELMELRSLIEIGETEIKPTPWDTVWNPFLARDANKKRFHIEQMDIDLPLDLSVNRE